LEEPDLSTTDVSDQETAKTASEEKGAPAAPPAGMDSSYAGLARLIESLLFVASSSVSIAQLAQALAVGEANVEPALEQLATACTAQRRGLMVQRRGDRVQLVTAPDAGPYIERFLGLDLTTKLSQAALESLALIAYRQPITRAQIEAVRGVNCDGVLRTLLARGLVEPVGRLEQAGRPFLYGTTFQFLQYFGIEDLEHLPPLPDD
jgi:segregation and condensation protein B